MRRVNHLFERIIDRENLRLAVHKALRGKRSKGDAREFVSPDKNLDWTRAALIRGDFPVGVYHQFTIFDPKQRLITAPCFRGARPAPRNHERLRTGLRAVADR